MSIQEHLNKIRNAVYGREVRESIAKGIETAYDDASEKHDNANMEVKIARGTNPNLNTRLNKMDETDRRNTEKIDSNYNEVTTQLTQTKNDKVDKDGSQQVKWGNIAQDAREQISGAKVAVVGRDSVGEENITDNAVLKRHVEFITPKNLFNGNYIEGHISGDVSAGGYFVTTNENARSAVLKIKPNTTYQVTKNESSDWFRIALSIDYPLFSGRKVSRYVKDANVGDTKGIFQFTTEAEEYVVITVSLSGEEPHLVVEEKNEVNVDYKIESKNFTKGKNLFDGEYQYGVLSSIGTVAPQDENGGRYIIQNIKPNTSYAISKTPSSRFAIGLINDKNALSDVIRFDFVFQDNNANKAIITTRENDLYLLVYVSVTPETPDFVQIEEGSEVTEWEHYGYKIEPLAKPYYTLKDGEGGVTEDIINLKDFGVIGDGISDDTLAVQTALDAGKGKKVIIPPNFNMLITKTIWIDSGTILEGAGKSSRFILGDNFTLDNVVWREGSPNRFPIIATRKDSSDIKLKNFRITGNKNQRTTQQQVGLGIFDTEYIVIEDVDIEYINWFPDEPLTSSWSLVLLRSKNIHIIRGNYEYGGYENFGSEDVDNVKVTHSYFGIGGRTSFQIHRGSKNVLVDGIKVEQNHENAHSGITIHGSEDNPVDNIVFDKITLRSITDNTLTHRGGIQSVEGHEHNVKILNSDIEASNEAIRSNSIDWNYVDGWKVTGNRIKGKMGASIRGNNTIVKDNIIDVDSDAVTLKGDNFIAKENILINNKDVSLDGLNTVSEDNI